MNQVTALRVGRIDSGAQASGWIAQSLLPAVRHGAGAGKWLAGDVIHFIESDVGAEHRKSLWVGFKGEAATTGAKGTGNGKNVLATAGTGADDGLAGLYGLRDQL